MTCAKAVHDGPNGPRIARVRHELKFRSLEVERIVRLTPSMLRFTLSGGDLSDFVSLAPDDHLKVLVPSHSGSIERRDYTPRAYDPGARTLVLDFAIHDAGHDAGPATRWARNARPGDKLDIGGPRGSAVISSEIERWLLIGDETALPAIGRRIEEASSGAQITSVVAVTGPDEHQAFETGARLSALWAHRPLSSADDPSALLSILETIDLQPETFVWVAAEAAVTRAIRTYLVQDRAISLGWIKVAGYWVMGKADAHVKFD